MIATPSSVGPKMWSLESLATLFTTTVFLPSNLDSDLTTFVEPSLYVTTTDDSISSSPSHKIIPNLYLFTQI